MTEKYIYSGRETNVETSAGKKGILIRSGSDYFFRVYHNNESFTDYELRIDDLSITIDPEELASFYNTGDRHILDHSPKVLDLNTVDPNEDQKGA